MLLRQASRWVGPDGGHCGLLSSVPRIRPSWRGPRTGPNGLVFIPGIGAQGAIWRLPWATGPIDLAGPVINAGRSVLYASSGSRFCRKAREAAVRLRDETMPDGGGRGITVYAYCTHSLSFRSHPLDKG